MVAATKIKIVGYHRGVALHDQQPAERIQTVVIPELDHVLDMSKKSRPWSTGLTTSSIARKVAF
jgi:hypothetical protein